MTHDQNQKLRAWVSNWNETGKVLEALQREDIRRSSLPDVIPAFDTAFRSALWLSPASPYSGLVEFHRLLARNP